MKNIFFVTVFLLGIADASHGQRLKYKDIFALLERKQYTEAEPLLHRYLQTEKDNPNAFLFMGIIATEKYLSSHSQDLEARQAALSSLRQARLGIDKKEISKNERYYALYKRRNLRTGELEVILDDIIADIDSRIASLTPGPGGN